MPIWRAASCVGSRSTRTAYFCAPNTFTCATPVTIEIRCARTVSAYRSTCASGSVSELRVRNRTGKSEGLLLLYDGGVGMPGGRPRADRAIAVCTSCAAESMLRSRSLVNEMFVLPWLLRVLMDVMLVILAKDLSCGVSTYAAIVSGMALGCSALSCMTG